MIVAEEVQRFVARLAPEPVCDACIAAKLDLSGAEEATRSTIELAGSAGMVRERGSCGLCGREGPVIRKS